MFVFGGNNGGIRDDYKINNSLRFRASASAYLSRTPASAGNRTTWTWSGWVKRGTLDSGTTQYTLFNNDSANTDAGYMTICFKADALRIAGFTTVWRTTSQVFRDPSAWYHIVVVWDTTQATAADRVKLYINGLQVTAFSTSNNPTLNATSGINANTVTYIGADVYTGPTAYLDGYLAEVNFIDGQALTPSSFGQTHPKTGVWRPKPYTGTYGTNGFYLQFSNIALTSGSNTGLGKDFSGNGNYWNTNNISVTSGTTYDAMIDSPTLGGTATQPAGNYATLNPNAKASSITLSEANLKSVDASGSFTVAVFATQTVFDKCYWEFQITNVGANAARGTCGVLPSNYTPTTFANDTLVAGITALGANSVGMCPQVSAIYQNGATTGISTGSWVANDVIMIAYNNGKLWMGRNGTWANSGDPAAGTGEVASGLDTSAMPVICNRNSQTWYANFGQRPFSYTPPTGFKSFCTSNLPNVTVPKGNKYMDATLYTGNGANRSITNAGSFSPDLVWGQARSAAYGSWLFDTVRGATKQIESFGTNAESTQSTMLTAFNSDGFSMGTDTAGNNSGTTYVAWQWDAGSSTITNTSGSISSQVRTNTTAGVSVITWSGNSTSGATVGHGLGVVPKMILVKARNAADNWAVYHSSTGATQYLQLNNTNASASSITLWNDTAPTSSVIYLGTNNDVNDSARTYVAYCFAEIAGFSKFTSYTGNGSADGPFVYTGFRPKFIIYKRTNLTGSWGIFDTSRNPYNLSTNVLYANLSDAEYTSTGAGFDNIDILSNGFKPRQSNSGVNASGSTYIYMAFAENPFKYSLAR